MAKAESYGAAWGVEIGGSALRVARVERTAAGFRLAECHVRPLDDRWTSSPDLRAAARRLGAGKVGEPLALAVADELILYRCLSLPAADGEALERMAAGQLEALLPAQEQRFALSWTQWADPLGDRGRRVLLCAARGDEIERAVRGCAELGRRAEVVMPSAWALAAAVATGRPTDEAVLLIDVAARTTTLALLLGGGLHDCGLVDQGGDHWTERIAEVLGRPIPQAERAKLAYCEGGTPDAVDRQELGGLLRRELRLWTHQLREVYGSLVEPLPAARRPKHCLLAGRASRTPGLAEAVGGSLGLTIAAANAPQRLSLAGGTDFASAATAAGAAIRALDVPSPELNLAPRVRRKRRPFQAIRWSWAAVVAWVLIALAVLYGLDVDEARSMRHSLRRVREVASRGIGLDRQLKVTSHLRPNAAGPLDVLDEVSTLAEKEVMLSTLHYERDGRVSFTGTLKNEQQFHAFLVKLRKSELFDDVTYRTAKIEKKKFHFEIALHARRAKRPHRKPPEAKKKPEADKQPKPKQAPPKKPPAATSRAAATTKPAPATAPVPAARAASHPASKPAAPTTTRSPASRAASDAPATRGAE